MMFVRTWQKVLVLVALALAVTACATTPKFNLETVDKTIQPSAVVNDFAKYKGVKVLWGGLIISSVNLKDGTQFEILAQPLNSRHKPQVNEKTTGRFIVLQKGYLETVDYAPGRLLSVVGTVSELKHGKIGEADYTYPVVRAEHIFLWPQGGESQNSTFHFGVGVGMVFH
jgi:outer membrane lipoprotein